ncbi:MAG: FtsX-like permease family protein [Stygiobacter sp.]|uniref:ABC transporter permease n=1 Tax=Stygiobacter electus TaxID=3032292 RepID=A0AAE3TBI4_9BACT|nr:FtsX-like permease family protein [Stygiobacter electus]MDF1610830.1 ABC transporter permease [Stygiobacter electus]
MKILKLIFKNAFRHKLRTLLTILGITIAIIAFGLLRTVVTIWDSSVDATMANRLITRQAISFIFPLPVSYQEKIKSIDGVSNVTFATWFQGVYKDKNNFFARIAVDVETFFDVYPEFLIDAQQLENFKKQRNSCVIGADIAEQYKLKIGDPMTLEGDIYPGRWDFVIAGIYKGKNKNTDETQMIFHWNYINERMKVESPIRANEVGWYIVQIKDPNKSAIISEQIDALFRNSSAETKTETEKAFAQNFVASSGAIISAMNVMSFAIIGIIMLVVANTMIMSARERTREYAILKTLGFSAKHLFVLILGESLLISFIGGSIGISLIFPIVQGFEQAMPKGIFPFFFVEPITIFWAIVSIIFVGFISAVFPIQKALSTRIVDGFRFVG